MSNSEQMIPDRSLFWHDLSVYTNRRRKAAIAFVRVANTVRESPTLSEACADFLMCYSQFSEASPESFTRLWSEPFAYYWSRAAEELISQWQSQGDDSFDRLVRHLNLIKLLVIGLDSLEGTSCRFQSPLVVALPLALPGLPVALAGEGQVGLHAVANGQLDVEYQGRRLQIPLQQSESWRDEQLTREFCPQIGLGEGYSIRLQPPAIKLPGLEVLRRDDLPTHALQEEHSQTLAEAVAAIGRFLPEATAQLRFGACVVVLKRASDSGPRNSSYSRLPGAALIGCNKNALVLAEDIIHEMHHNRLYAIEENGSFFLDDRVHSTRDESFYSPWRSDPRPLYGVLHAVYVFSRVLRYWLNVARCGEVTGQQHDYAMQRCAMLNQQLATGEQELEKHADFSEAGERLFAAMQSELSDLRQQVKSEAIRIEQPALICEEDGTIAAWLGMQSGLPLSVAEALHEHRQRFLEENHLLVS